MKKTLHITLLSTLIIWHLGACYYDVEQELYPGGCDPAQLDTANVTFSGQINTTLKTYCLNCHSTTNAPSLGAGIVLDQYNGVKAYVDNGKLYASVTHASGASPMPKGTGNKIPQCDIVLLKAWIDHGAPNN